MLRFLCSVSERKCTGLSFINQIYLKPRHQRRWYAESAVEPSIDETGTTGRKRLVILGTGWSSYACVKQIDKSVFDVYVISPRNHFLFTPLLASTTVGTLEFRSIIEPIRNVGFRNTDHFHLSWARKLDLESKTVTCESTLKPGLTYDIPYDHLVIGVGSFSSTLGIPGVLEHAFFLKEIQDARKIRDRIVCNFELACQPDISPDEVDRLLHIVIVGGGPTGVEFGAELYDFFKTDVHRVFRKNEQRVKVTLIEATQILNSFDERLRKYAEKKMKQRENFNLLQSAVTEVREDGVTLKDGTVIPCGLVVWSTGLAPRYFTRGLEVPKNERGQIITDGYLQVSGTPPGTVFAIGDCADIQKQPLPCTAQVAEREGRYLANLLNKGGAENVNPFRFHSMGMLAYIGGFEGLSDLPDFKLKGFPSWLLWRSAYLTRLGSWRLRLQVPLDWLKTLLFGRDISRF